MALADLLTAVFPSQTHVRPRDDEIDLYGVTHPGKVRKQNQDHFMLCTIHPQAVVHGTSLPDQERLPLRGQRLATLLLVADGVGSGTGGGEASQLAAESITRYITSTLRCYHTAGTAEEHEFHEALRAAALEAHDAVRAQSAARAEVEDEHMHRGMATTLTLALAVWPWAYVVQVGDSRCYHLNHGQLHQVTRDQTMAQDLVDQGALPPALAASSPLSHVLASAIGGREAVPVVSRLDIRERGCVLMLCSDGLTKHVTDEEIERELQNMTSSKQVAERLLDLALENGGSDNITILVGRARRDSTTA